MRKLAALMVLAGLVLTGCLKNEEPATCTDKTVESEVAAMTKFATDSTIHITTDSTGVMYEIMEPGEGPAPTSSSTVKAKYVGRTLNGQLFDSSEGVEFPLRGVIRGWQIGIPKIKQGGKIKLIIPSSLAYGCYGYYGALANQPLYFYVELLEVK